MKNKLLIGIAALVLLFGFASAKSKNNTATPTQQTTQQTTSPININKATEQQIAALPGVGDKLAQEIIKGRPFKDMPDLIKRVKGIGLNNSKKLIPLVTF